MEYYYCEICKRPLTCTYFKLCDRCNRQETYTGFYRLKKISRVRWDTLQYSHHLSRAVRGYYVNVNLSAPKAERVAVKVPPKDVDYALDILLKGIRATWGELSLEIFEILHANDDKFLKRMLYNMCLYNIAYYIENSKAFVTEQHFVASMVHSLFMEMKRSHFKHRNKVWFPKGTNAWWVNNKERAVERHMSRKMQRKLVASVKQAVGLIIRHYG